MLNGRVALVTGGGRGIGRAICSELAKQGANIVVNYNGSEDAARQLVDEIKSTGREAISIKANVSDQHQVEMMLEEILRTYGKLDILVNNSGIMLDSTVEDMSLEEWDKVISINLRGVFICTKAAIPLLKAHGGRIINVSSQAALTGSRRHAHYAASKAGVLGLTYSLAKELGRYDITVNAVSPGRIKTEMVNSRMSGREEEWIDSTPLKRLGNPGEVASAVAFLASDGASYITGANLYVNGGILMG